MEKYELVRDETTDVDGVTLYRIRALRDIPRQGVAAGDFGGFVERCENLSQVDDAWVADDAMIYGNARVSGNARVFGNAQVYGCAQVSDHVYVFDYAHVYGNARVYGNAHVYGNARVYGDACIAGEAEVRAQHDWVYISHVPNAAVFGRSIENLTAYRDVRGQICIMCRELRGELTAPVVADWLNGTVLADILNACMAEPVQENSD